MNENNMPSDWAIAQVVREMAASDIDVNSLTTRMEGQRLLQLARELEARVFHNKGEFA